MADVGNVVVLLVGLLALVGAVFVYLQTRFLLARHGADVPPLQLHKLLNQQHVLQSYLNLALSELEERGIGGQLVRDIQDVLEDAERKRRAP